MPDHESSTALKSRYHLPLLRLYRDQPLRLYTGAPACSSPATLVYWPRVCDAWAGLPAIETSPLPSFWYTTIFSTSLASDHESVTLLLGRTCRAVDGAHPVSPLVSTEQSEDPLPQLGSTSD